MPNKSPILAEQPFDDRIFKEISIHLNEEQRGHVRDSIEGTIELAHGDRLAHAKRISAGRRFPADILYLRKINDALDSYYSLLRAKLSRG